MDRIRCVETHISVHVQGWKLVPMKIKLLDINWSILMLIGECLLMVISTCVLLATDGEVNRQKRSLLAMQVKS